MNRNEKKQILPKPAWLKTKANLGRVNMDVTKLLRKYDLHTVCEAAACPNCGECFGSKTATFMILGDRCTRSCRFCAVSKGVPDTPDTDEPVRVANAAAALGLMHTVVTSVTRDDLPDGGAGHFAKTVEALKKLHPKTVIEVLIPDFQGSDTALQTVIREKPHIINHNVETVPRLYSIVRPNADYQRSLSLLKKVKVCNDSIVTKSGLMVGLGETDREIEQVMDDLRSVHCDLLTIGQYLAPTKSHLEVYEYITPAKFAEYEKKAYAKGFSHAACAPLVRSSYMARQAYEMAKGEK